MIFFDFSFYLTLAVIILGVIVLIDRFALRAKRAAIQAKEPIVVEYARSLFPVLLLVWIIRSFIVQPYRVPTGSLEPTILAGDFIVATQFSYGLHLPASDITLIPTGTPKRGDIALFHFPKNPSVVFVKRVIGLPGDHIVYHNKTLTINGVRAPQTLLGTALSEGPYDLLQKVEVKEENLLGIKHKIWVQPVGGETQSVDVTVPKGHYFMMGDNRDDSDDSRMWGFVPQKYLIGKAAIIWMSWDSADQHIRWSRIGQRVH